jgi:hypothetical protein
MIGPRDSRNIPPFDQGVYLVHLNKGKEAQRANDLEGARLELEIALKYRPDDEELLNLLGMVYYKLRLYPEAEVMYGKLVAKNPDVFILRSNLGLVLFKQGRVEEALPHFKRAVELKPNYLKAHLYLGHIYRKKGKYGLALEHFTFAQAPQHVKEMEEALRRQRESAAPEAGEPFPHAVPPPPPSLPARLEEAAGPLPAAPGARTTAEIGRPAAAETTQPIPVVKAEGRPYRSVVESLHKEASVAPETIDLTARPAAPASEKKFILHHNGFLEIHAPGRVYIKKSSLRSYNGNFRFSAVQALHATSAHQIHEAAGNGKLFLFEKNYQTYLFELNQEFVYVEGSHILALEDDLAFRFEPIHDYRRDRRLETFKVYGRGALALLTHLEPLTLRVTPDYPLTILSRSLVAWTGHLYPVVTEEEPGDGGGFNVRFEGEGIIIADETL